MLTGAILISVLYYADRSFCASILAFFYLTSPRVFVKQKRNVETREYKGAFLSGRRKKSGNAAAKPKFNSYFHMQSPTTEQVTQQLNSRSEAEIDAEVESSSLDFVLREGTL